MLREQAPAMVFGHRPSIAALCGLPTTLFARRTDVRLWVLDIAFNSFQVLRTHQFWYQRIRLCRSLKELELDMNGIDFAYSDMALAIMSGETEDRKEPRVPTSSRLYSTELSAAQQSAAVKIERISEVCKRTGRSKSHLYNSMQVGGKYYDPDFPRPVKLWLSAAAVGWISSEITAWIELQIARRDALQCSQGQKGLQESIGGHAKEHRRLKKRGEGARLTDSVRLHSAGQGTQLAMTEGGVA